MKSAAVRRNKPEPWYRKHLLFWRDRSPEAKKSHEREQRNLTELVLDVAKILGTSPMNTLTFYKLDWQHRREVLSRYQWSRE